MSLQTDAARDECLRLVRYRLQAVDVFRLALKQKLDLDQPQSLDIWLGGKLIIQGNSNLYLNPVLDIGVIYCRALLDFLGLCYKPEVIYGRTETRNDNDFGIEQFGLSCVQPEQALSLCPITRAEAELALAAVFRTANKSVAHITKSLFVGDTGRLHTASQMVRDLFRVYFYRPLGIAPPEQGLTLNDGSIKQ